MCVGITSHSARAKGATQEAHLFLIAAFCRLAKSLSHSEQMGWLVGAVGIEPTTFGLKGRCSTTELRPYLLSSVYRETVWRASRLAHISFRTDRIAYCRF